MFFCLLLYVSSFGQPYQSIFGKEKTVFHIVTPITCYDPNPNQLGCVQTNPFETTSKDTITINGLFYQIFNPSSYNWEWGYGFVREDTMTGKIYRYIPDLKEEFLICDMTLNVGDTFQLPNISEPYPPFSDYWYWEQGYNAIVKQIDTVESRKIIEFYPISDDIYSFFYNERIGYMGVTHREFNIYLKFIEGIGPIYGPFGPLNRYMSHERKLGAVLCVYRDDSLYYMTSELLGCSQDYVKIDESESPMIRISPNPVHDFVSMEVMDNMMGGKLFILNSVGMVVYQGYVSQNPIELNVSHLSAGFYSVLYETSKERTVSKFVKMK